MLIIDVLALVEFLAFMMESVFSLLKDIDQYAHFEDKFRKMLDARTKPLIDDAKKLMEEEAKAAPADTALKKPDQLSVVIDAIKLNNAAVTDYLKLPKKGKSVSEQHSKIEACLKTVGDALAASVASLEQDRSSYITALKEKRVKIKAGKGKASKRSLEEEGQGQEKEKKKRRVGEKVTVGIQPKVKEGLVTPTPATSNNKAPSESITPDSSQSIG